MTKTLVFKLGRAGVYVAAIGQLALSQIHIEVITRVFEPSVGFFLFLFVTFGVVTAFSSSSLHKGTGVVPYLMMCTAAIVTGLIYQGIVIRDVRLANLLTLQEALGSLVFSFAVIAVYVVASVVMLLTRKRFDARE